MQENLFLDNDTAISVLHDDISNPLNMVMNCNKFELLNSETYTRYGLFIHDDADIDDIGGNNPSTFDFPSGNGWPVDPSSPGYSNCITGTGGSINLALWSEPANWTSIEDNSSSSWDYFAYNNEFTGTFSPSSILNRQLGSGNNAPSCQVTDICFPLPRIKANLENNQSVNEFKVYPNPARDNVSLSISGGNDNVTQIVLFDARLIKHDILFTVEKDTIKIDVSDMKSGLYIVFVRLNDGSYLNSKLIIE